MALRTVRVKVGDKWYTVQVEDLSTSPVRVTVEGETYYVEVEGRPTATPADRQASGYRQPRAAPGQAQARTPVPKGSDNLIRSPMPGKVVSVNVKPGESVAQGQEVCVVEAMKMEQVISAPRDGVIKAVHAKPMQQVGQDDALVELE